MKLHHKNNGTVLLVVLLALLVLIIGGIIIYIIVHYSGMPGRDPSQDADDMSLTITQDSEVVEQFFPSFSLDVVTQLAQPESTATIERTTNLVDWEDLYTIPSGQPIEINDTNPPYPNAFYRVRFN